MSELRKAINDLNRFLNIKSSSDMIKQLLEPRLTGATKDQKGTYESNLTQLVQSLLSIQGTGMLTEDMIKGIDAYASGDSSDPLTKQLKGPVDSNTPTKDLPPFFITRFDSGDVSKGYMRNKNVLEVLQQTPPGDTSPAHKKSMSVIEICAPELNFNNRDCSAVATFLQTLPSIEISRAVPYFDCKVITRVSKSSDAEQIEAGKKFQNGVSIGRFLGGQITETGESQGDKYLLARITSEQTIDKNVLNNLQKKPPSEIASTASMELFTTPQTLVQGNSTFADLNASSEPLQTPITEDQKIMDKFRPLMTWESFNLTVAPATGMIATKTGDAKLKLHDRSRMNQIAPLLTPARTGDVELHITWGWSHPDNNPSNNPYGALIDSMKVTEIYGVMNSSYSFTPEGQVDITLKLYTKGAQNVAFDLIKGRAKQGNGKNTVDALQEAVKAMRGAITDLRGQGYNIKEDIGAPDVLGKATSTKGMLSLSAEEIKELEDFVKQLGKVSTKSSGAVFKDFSNKFSQALSQSKDFASQQSDYIQQMIDEMMKSDDPYLAKPNITFPGGSVNIKKDTHVSFAKFLLYMVGDSILHTGKYDEVQFVFYPMNEYSMWAKDYNIGQYPMNKSMLLGLFKDEFSKQPTMRIQRLLNLVRKFFMNNVGDDIYGFGEFYDDKNKLELKEDYEKKEKKQTMSIRKQEIMEACYGPGTQRRFKKPNVNMFVESVQNQNGKTILRLHFSDRNCTSYSSYADLWSTTNKSNLGIIAKHKKQLTKQNKEAPQTLDNSNKKKAERDEEKNPQQTVDHTKVYNEAVEYFIQQGVLKSLDNGKYVVNGGPERLRGLMTSNMPTLKYGTEFSGILSANLSTQSNPQMETIHMVRQKRGSKPNTPGQDGMPMRVRPAQLSLDTFGCPVANFGQQFFIDFNTNSTIDDVYAVTGVSHTITPGDFKSSIKMVPLQKLGQFGSLVDTLDDIKTLADDAGKESDS